MMYSNEGSEDLDDNVSGGLDYDEPAPNLEVIYQAFGERADLYKDVLQVKTTATAEQIQMAYFDRRSELFALLASIDSEEEQDDITASHRFHAERKMDAVVMAVRIVGDPQLRQEYDNVMLLQTKKQPREPPSSMSEASKGSSSLEPDGVYAGVAKKAQQEPPASPRAQRSPKRRSAKIRSLRHVSPSDNDTLDDNANKLSSDEALMHQHFQHHPAEETSYEFVAQSISSKESKSSSTNKAKHKKGHKKKHHQDHHLHHHHHHHTSHNQTYQQHDLHDPSFDQSTLDRPDDDTFRDATIGSATFEGDITLDRTWEEQATVASGSTAGNWTLDHGGTSTLSNITHGGIVSRIQEEVAGTVEDTLVSFEQVLNVFTLQERDIQAVMGRIDKAKRQLRKRR
jgi:hypothetical protein